MAARAGDDYIAVMFRFRRSEPRLPHPDHILPGRDRPLPPPAAHAVSGHPMHGPWSEGHRQAMFGLGCFWGAERAFWTRQGVYSTQVGYSGGATPNPTYDEVCSGRTGHNEVVRVVFDPQIVSFRELLTLFWEAHDPTQGMRQGNDVGTQYRSAVYVFDPEQRREAEDSRDAYQEALLAAGRGGITTEIVDAGAFYFAEEYHQQYLAKNPGGYCGLGGTGVKCGTSVFESD